MKSKSTLIIFSVAFLFCIQASAQEALQPTTAASSASLKASSPASSTSNAKTLPRLSIRWDCDTCEQNPKVAPLIEQSYSAQAAAKGYAVSTSENAEIVIKEYRQRNPATRVLFGVFAGKDKLTTKLNFRGKEYAADDYSANAFQGMNSLCESVAQQAMAHVLMAIKE